ISATDLKFEAKFDPVFGQTIYPSVILALANFSAQQENGLELIKYNVTSPEANSKLKVVLGPSTVNDESVLQETLTANGQTYSFIPSINWNYDKLKTLSQPGNTNLSFTAYVNDQETD